MSEEIKETLDRTLEYLEEIDKTRGTKILTTNETNILLDYITNLQQKIEQLEKENEKLKYLVDDSHTMKAFIVEHNKVEQLENIRKEAIKYINNNNHIDGCLIKWEVADLLNILNKGDNK